MDGKHFYDQGDITVVWEPAKCVHSGICARGLPTVFRPRERPWIVLVDVDADTSDEANRQVPFRRAQLASE